MATLAESLQRAIADHEAGRLEAAELGYRKILVAAPREADALHLLGVILHQQGRHTDGLDMIRQAIGINSQNAAYYSNLGVVLRALGRREEAIAELRKGIQVDPNYLTSYRNLGSTLNELGRHEEAAAVLLKLVAQQPKEFVGWKQLGIAQYRRGQLLQAIQAFQKATELNANDAEALNNLGVALKDAGRQPEAAAIYRRAIAARPNYADVHNNLGILLTEQGDLRGAIPSFREALQHNPKLLDARHNLGVALRDVGQAEEAERLLAEVLQADPGHAEAHNNLGVAYQHRGNYDLALRHYEHALRAKPDHIWAHFNRSQVWLLLGRYLEGFLEYEWRWKRPGTSARSFPCPLWDGSVRPEQTILLHAEQGLGDTLQFLRFVPMVAQRVGKIVVECQGALVKLLTGYPGIEAIVAKGSPLPPFDLQAPLMSLAAILGSTADDLPGQSSYLSPDPALAAKWQERLAEIPGRKIGINWQGNPKFHRDATRSFPLTELAPIAAIPNVSLVSLQKVHGQSQIAELAGRFHVVDWTSELDEASGPFLDTAAILARLDLLITSDSAVAHLAGALGVKTWLAVSHSPDWRWHAEGESSPWYPSMQLFRQKSPGDWTSVFAAMAEALTTA